MPECFEDKPDATAIKGGIGRMLLMLLVWFAGRFVGCWIQSRPFSF